jgi:hypothetical protein
MPCARVGDKATYNRAESWSDPDHTREAGHGIPPFDWVPEIGEDAWGVTQRGADKSARQEPPNQQTGKVWGKGA